MLRESKVIEQMELLGITDVTTPRQARNGTVVWRLPIKNKWNNGSYIEVASFKTGYVRNNNSCSTNYQLNKRYDNILVGTRGCILIPREIDRLEYLISYCLKNYYIKHANFVADGEYVPKWKYNNLADAARLDYEGLNVSVNVNGERYKVI